MSDLTISKDLNPIPEVIREQSTGFPSGLYLTNEDTGTIHIKSNGKFVFGLDGPRGGGEGEWMQNSRTNFTTNDFGIAFYTVTMERMRLTNTGLGIGTKTPTTMLEVAGNVKISSATKPALEVDGGLKFVGLDKASTGDDLVVDLQGNVSRQVSSERFKENVIEFKDDFSKILSLNPVSFQSKQTGETGLGYIAEDLQAKDLKSLVGYDGDGKPFSVHYKLVPVYLLEVLKEQQKMIKQLQSEMAELKNAVVL